VPAHSNSPSRPGRTAPWSPERQPLRRGFTPPTPGPCSPNRIAREASFPNRPGRYRLRRLRWLGDDAFGNARGGERRDLALFSRSDAREPFVARWCASSKVETAGGVFQVREDEPALRVGAGLHRTPRGGEISNPAAKRRRLTGRQIARQQPAAKLLH
jgi:hypothetical protein